MPPVGTTPAEQRRMQAARRRAELARQRREAAERRRIARQQAAQKARALSGPKGVTTDPNLAEKIALGNRGPTVKPGRKPSARSVAPDIDALMAAAAIRSLRPDIERSAAAAPGASWRSIESFADLATGIPSFVRDPSAVGGLMVALNPWIRGGRLAKEGLETGIRTLVSQTGAKATIPAAGSMLGRGAEKVQDVLRSERQTQRRIAAEWERSKQIHTRALSGPGQAARRIGRRFKPDQQVAFSLVAEGMTSAQRTAFHAGKAAEAPDAFSRALHGAHESLATDAARYVVDTPTGPVLAPGAPKQMHQAWKLMQESGATREDIYKAMNLLTEERAAQRLHAPGRKMVGGEEFKGGKLYIPDVRGTPGQATIRPRDIARQANVFLRGGWRKTVSGKVTDKNLREWTGALRDTGFLRTDVTNLTADSLAKALKLDSIRWYRDKLLPAATDLPQALDDIPIKLKPGAENPDALEKFWDFWEVIQRGGFSADDVQRFFKKQDMDGLLQELFPRTQVDATELLVPGAEPIPGIKWVSSDLLHESTILNPLSGRMFQGGKGGAVVGNVVDAYNDLARAAILYLNPAYGPVQLIQNATLNLFQQGPFILPNILRAAKLSRQLGETAPDVRASINELMGTGLTKTLSLRTKGVRDITGPVGNLVRQFTDTGPRWLAFVHEARKSNVHSPEDFVNLFRRARTDENAMQKIDLITRRAVDAIGDFERLSPMEKNVVSRVIFFYPWLKAATRLTYRFPLEHPFQAAAYSYGGLEAKEYADEKLGDRPWYAMFEVPVRGMEDKQGNPYTFNLARLIPWSTPAEFAAAIGAGVMGIGPNEAPQIIEKTVPFLQAGVSALTGRGQFGEEFTPGLPTFFRESYKDLPPSRFVRAFSESDEEKADRMFPRTKTDEAWRVGFGGLAFKPYNVRAGQERATGEKKKLTKPRRMLKTEENAVQRIQNRRALLTHLEDLGYDPGWADELTTAARVEEDVTARVNAAIKKAGVSERAFDPKELARIKLEALVRERPELGAKRVLDDLDNLPWDDEKWAHEFSVTRLNGLLYFKDIFGVQAPEIFERLKAEYLRQIAPLEPDDIEHSLEALAF